MIPMQISEIADRYTIAYLKASRLPPDKVSDFHEQARFFREGLDFAAHPGLCDLVENLLEVNGLIWDTEDALRTGEETLMTLAQVGQIALRVRDLNRKRCLIKNQIVDLTGDGFRDVKHNYASGDSVSEAPLPTGH